MASHDGFTLADVTCYAARHNEANGEDNKDGQQENYSANWGVEGPTTDKNILETRRRIQRAMLATLLFADGTPMVLGGDELSRTQRGNNNPYCQDNDVSWWSWHSTAESLELQRFVAGLIAIRKRFAALRPTYFLHAEFKPAPGIADIAWFDEQGKPIPDEDWRNPEHRLLCIRRANRNDAHTVFLLTLLLNPTADNEVFQLPTPQLPSRILIDTANPTASEADVKEQRVEVGAHSAVLVFASLESAPP